MKLNAQNWKFYGTVGLAIMFAIGLALVVISEYTNFTISPLIIGLGFMLLPFLALLFWLHITDH